MIEKIVHKHRMERDYEIKQNLEYWLTKTPEERLSAVELLRQQMYGDSKRIKRTARVIKRTQS